MALAASGQLYSWGMGMDGRLGHGDIAHRDGPTLVAGLEDAGVALLSIAAGTSHSLAADAEGTLWTWGCGLTLGVVVKGFDNHAAATRDLERYRRTHIVWHTQLPCVFFAYNVFLVCTRCGGG